MPSGLFIRLARVTSLKLSAILLFSLIMACPAQSDTAIFKTSQHLIIENVDLSTKNYLDAKKNGGIDRQYAEISLLGILGATLDEQWCDYRTFKTITIADIVYSKMKNIPKQYQAERASKFIVSILTENFLQGGKMKHSNITPTILTRNQLYKLS